MYKNIFMYMNIFVYMNLFVYMSIFCTRIFMKIHPPQYSCVQQEQTMRLHYLIYFLFAFNIKYAFNKFENKNKHLKFS